MTQVVNPYDHLPTNHLQRQLRRVSRKLTRLAMSGDPKGNFEYLRVIFVSISNTLERREEKAMLENIATLPEFKPETVETAK